MRVELIYTPGCNSYKRLLNSLETVIAEERLPIPVTVIESLPELGSSKSTPTIRIDGDDIGELTAEPHSESCRSEHTLHGSAGLPCLESLRAILYRRWKDLTEKPLLGA